ncbi:hypothetical protein KZO83_07600 [Chromohalobacter sp. TMW 2.2308]|uniref:hypothetical protein n=1 Tax=Chromohalobacter moromii TaxID=2860329 RepID=UPI001FFCA142|nr:hypothetical protein [Chromohalobacter moromii]MCK2042551.1 hypothetical protein [Chromohalobacter moromii]
MIARLLRLFPAWAWMLGAAGVAGLLGWWRIEAVTAERDAAQLKSEQMQQNVEQMQLVVNWARAQSAVLSVALEDRAAELERIRRDVMEHRQALDQLEANDADTREWSGKSVPSAVADWVRQLSASGRDGDDDADNSRTPDAPVVGTEYRSLE